MTNQIAQKEVDESHIIPTSYSSFPPSCNFKAKAEISIHVTYHVRRLRSALVSLTSCSQTRVQSGNETSQTDSGTADHCWCEVQTDHENLIRAKSLKCLQRGFEVEDDLAKRGLN